MLSGRYKRRTADARSRQWKRRFYGGAAATTLLYVVLSLVAFHGKLSPLPTELPVIWAVFLLCYASFNEVLRWNGMHDRKPHRGELWAGLVVTGALWMIVWNIIREWILNLPSLPIPPDYEAATVETIVLYTLSVISYILYKYRQAENRNVHHKSRTRGARAEPRPAVLAQPAVAEKKEPPAATPV